MGVRCEGPTCINLIWTCAHVGHDDWEITKLFLYCVFFFLHSIMGTGRRVKTARPSTKVVAVEWKSSRTSRGEHVREVETERPLKRKRTGGATSRPTAVPSLSSALSNVDVTETAGFNDFEATQEEVIEHLATLPDVPVTQGKVSR